MPETWSCMLTRHDALASWEPMCRILYRLLSSLARLAVRLGRSQDLEIIIDMATNTPPGSIAESPASSLSLSQRVGASTVSAILKQHRIEQRWDGKLYPGRADALQAAQEFVSAEQSWDRSDNDDS